MAEGEISLFQAPAAQADIFGQGWISWQLKLSALTASGLLEKCLSAFLAQYANTPDTDIPHLIDTEIAKDMLRLQSSYPIAREYRHFVVIKATNASDGNTYGNAVSFIMSNSEHLLSLCR
jgi:hypothetical protein